MRHYGFGWVEEIGFTRDMRPELDARRAASNRRLVIDHHAIAHDDPPAYTYNVHLLDPRTSTCLAVRKSWVGMRSFIDGLTPIGLAKLLEKPRPCAVHPPPIAPDDDAAP